MIRRCAKWDEFEAKELARKDITYRDNLRIFESLRKEAVNLGVFASENIMDGFETDIKVARAMKELGK